ncbi:MAG: DEAD/DEAH box helicase [Candidatus Bathyarchaeia archaeon]
MIVQGSKPGISERIIPNFPFPTPFAHQYKFFENRNHDIILKSPTASGKTFCFLFSFINEYLRALQENKRIKCLYLVPTRLLVHSQFESLKHQLERFGIPHRILESGYSYAELFKHLWENDFIVASPDIVFYILLRKKKTQHIEFEYTQLLKSLYCVVFDELHLFDTYTMMNIKNLINIMKNQNPNINIYLLSATIDLKDVIDPSRFTIIDGESLTYPVKVSATALNYLDIHKVAEFLVRNQFQRNTVYVCNSVDRAIRLHSIFVDSALLVGKAWYEVNEETREDQIRRNLDKCKEGALTFATSVFRQGVDIDVKRMIVEEPLNAPDAIQTFGRCGRHSESEFILLTHKSHLLSELNSDKQVTRGEFEALLSKFLRPPAFEEQKRMMNAMWYKLYTTTRLKNQVNIIITADVKKDYEEFKDFLPNLGFREPMPSIKYDDIAFSIFEILAFKDAYLYIEPIDDPFFVGELLDGGKFVRREYRRAKKEDLPTLTLIEKKRYKDTAYYNLKLSLRDIYFSVNAKIGQFGDYPYILIDKTKLIPRSYSFEPCTFFE